MSAPTASQPPETAGIPVDVADSDALVANAWRAIDAQEFAQAIGHWTLIAETRPDDPAGFVGLAISYRALKDYASADATLAAALDRFPDDVQLNAHYAEVAQDRGDWTRAAERWQVFRSRFPDDPLGASALGVALRQLERYDEADAILSQALGSHPEHVELLGNYALTAQQRGDWQEALRRWMLYREHFPDHPTGYSGLGVALRELRRYDEAEATLCDGLRLAPDNAELLGNYAWVAYHRSDWPEALKRWEDFRDKFPDLPEGQIQVALVLEAMGRFDAAASLSQTRAYPPPKHPDPAALMLEFESLGDDCEFGVVQRHFGAEPLGLLRFASTPPALLVEALQQRFAGVGDPGNTELLVHDGEYMTRDRRYHMATHTFIRAQADDRERSYETFCDRLRFLRDKLLENLADREKYFVYAAHDLVTDHDIQALWDALRGYGSNRLLFVQSADATHPAGTVRRLHADLIVAHLARLSVSEPSYDQWLAVCREAHELWSSVSGSDGEEANAPAPDALPLHGVYNVRQHTGHWSIHDGASYRPIRNGGQPVAEFASGWRPRFLYGGLSPVFLLELAHNDGTLATWFLDENLDRIGGGVDELSEPVQATLGAKGRALRQRLWDFFCSPAPGFPPELVGYADLSPGTAAALAGLSGMSPAEFEWKNITEAERHRFPQIDLTLRTDLRQNYHEGLTSGCLKWPSPIDGSPLDCHSLYIDHMVTLYRCVDKPHALCFYVCCAGHDMVNVGVLFPGEATGYYLTEQQRHLADFLFHHLRQRIDRYLALDGQRLPEYFATPCATFATIIWPGESFHIGHHVWNELSGLQQLLHHVAADRRPDIVVMGKPGDGEAYGAIGDLFPELASRVRRGIETDAQLAALACREGIQLIRATGSHVAADLRRRILGLVDSDTRHDQERARIEALKAQGFTIVIIGLRVENRTVAGFDEFCARIVEHLKERLGRVAVAIDGHNTRDTGDGDGSHYPSFGESGAAAPLADAERNIAGFIETSFAASEDVAIVDNTGRSMGHSLLWAQHAQFFVSAWGAGLAKYRWVANLPGVIVSSRWVLTQKGDLHIYDGDAFMEAPSPVRFVDPKHVFDIAEEPVLVQVFDTHHPMYFNFKVNMKGLYREIDGLIGELGLGSPRDAAA